MRRILLKISEKVLEFQKTCLYLQSQSERNIIHSRGCGEMVDTLLWGGSGRWPVWVRVSPSARKGIWFFRCLFHFNPCPRQTLRRTLKRNSLWISWMLKFKSQVLKLTFRHFIVTQPFTLQPITSALRLFARFSTGFPYCLCKPVKPFHYNWN